MKIFCIVPMYRNLYVAAIESIDKQTYIPDGVVVVNDDVSTSSTTEFKYNTITLNRHVRHYAAKNIYDAIKFLVDSKRISDDDIVCLVDGDDQLYDETALSTVIRTYKQYDCWLTYGSYINLSDELKGVKTLHRSGYRNDENYREQIWRASHLKTFKYGLFKHLKQQSLMGPDGQWLRVCSDLAIMYPLLEMAGKERIRHIDKPLYIYNDLSELNDHKVAGKEQQEIDRWLRIQVPYQKLKKL